MQIVSDGDNLHKCQILFSEKKKNKKNEVIRKIFQYVVC